MSIGSFVRFQGSICLPFCTGHDEKYLQGEKFKYMLAYLVRVSYYRKYKEVIDLQPRASGGAARAEDSASKTIPSNCSQEWFHPGTWPFFCLLLFPTFLNNILSLNSPSYIPGPLSLSSSQQDPIALSYWSANLRGFPSVR